MDRQIPQQRDQKAFSFYLLLAVIICTVVSGCGGGGGGGNSGTAPAFSSASSIAFSEGVAGTFTVTATGSPAPTLSETGALPSGVTFTASTGVLAGTPAAATAGTYPITFTATNGVSPDATQSFTLTVDAPPSITSFGAANTTITDGTSSILNAVFTGGTGSIDNGVGAVTSGVGVTVTPTSTTTYKLTVTNSAGVSVPATTTVTVVPATNTGACAAAGTGSESLLNGRYAFLLKGFDNGTGAGESSPEPALVGGTLSFNGMNNNGIIESGILDQNLNSTAGTLTLIVTGTYVVGSDQRACLTLNTSSSTQPTQHYSVTLANISGNPGVAATGHMLDVDAAGPLTSGTLRQMSAIPASLSGNFAFGFSSPQNTAEGGGRLAAAGVFTFTPTTVSGVLDLNSSGQIDGMTAPASWPASAPLTLTNGTYSIGQNSGRGKMTVTPSGGAVSHSIFYVVSPTDLLIMNSDDQTATGVTAGEALQQSGTFQNSSFSGTYVNYMSSLMETCATCLSTATANASIGVLTASGSGTISAALQWNNQSGTITSGPALTGATYSVDSTGRVLFNGGTGPLYYMVNPNEAFILGAGPGAQTGMIELQSSTAAPSGSYAFGSIDPQEPNVGMASGIATLRCRLA